MPRAEAVAMRPFRIARIFAEAFRRAPEASFVPEPHRPRISACTCECRSAGGYEWLYPGLILPVESSSGCVCADREDRAF